MYVHDRSTEQNYIKFIEYYQIVCPRWIYEKYVHTKTI